ncbi:MAG: TIGR03668 family PPOX class F420-dependent oxidoreductase [Gammaproteobacteria bacterium]|nr:TIGR03668 family PPOX class F420-dependent oxidoreductase [Gammaproteobacteria bacterium]
MELTDTALAALLAREPVARLATLNREGRPHLVPVVFAPSAQHIYSPIDGKPKRGATLARIRNLDANPAAALLIDHYDHDWRALWWLRLDVHAECVQRSNVPAAEFAAAIAALTNKYPQYAATAVLRDDATLIRMRIVKQVAWSATDG